MIDVAWERKPERAPEIAAWLDWLQRHKGLAVGTLDNYERSLGKLLPLLGTDPTLYDAANLRSAFLDRCSSEGPRNARKSMAAALRSWLRYNAALGPSVRQRLRRCCRLSCDRDATTFRAVSSRRT